MTHCGVIHGADGGNMQGLEEHEPAQVGPYRLVKRLGAGGMGLVYLGVGGNGELVAVKVVHPGFAHDEQFRSRFAREVAVSRKVTGPWTAAVVDADPQASTPWLATEYVHGPSLDQAVRTTGPLPRDAVHVLAAGLARALIEIHGAGLIHRDIKPSNVLLAADGPRLIDFGISRAIDGTRMTTTGMIIGTPAFMSPEQAEGEDLGPASDVFSLGAVLVLAATGVGPFGDSTPLVILRRIVTEEPDLGSLAEPVRGIVAACLLRDREARPTPTEMAQQLQPVPAIRHAEWLPSAVTALIPPAPLASTGLDPGVPSTRVDSTPAGHPATPPEPTAGSGRRSLSRWWSIAAAIVAVGVLVGVLVATLPDPPSTTSATPPSATTPPLPLPARSVDVDVVSSRELATWGPVHFVEFSPDGQLVATSSSARDGYGGRDGVQLWEVTTGQPIGAPVADGYAVAFSPDGSVLATGGGLGLVTLWDVRTRRELDRLDAGSSPHALVDDVAFSPDGTTIATSAIVELPGETTDTVRLWNRATGDLVGTISDPRGFGPNTVQFSPDGRFLLISDASESAGWCEVATGRCIPMPFEAGPAALSDDGSTIASGGYDWRKNIVLIDTATRAKVGEIPLRSEVQVRALAFSPDGSVLAGAASDSGSALWDVATGRDIYRMRKEDRAVAFSPDGTLIAFGDREHALLMPVHLTANR